MRTFSDYTEVYINSKNILHTLRVLFKLTNYLLCTGVVRGRHTFMGYLGMENTKEVIDEGWLHSGDIGWLDKVSYIVKKKLIFSWYFVRSSYQ